MIIEEKNFRRVASNRGVPACREIAGMGCSHTFAEELTTEERERMAMPF
jgi:hypothetical protein